MTNLKNKVLVVADQPGWAFDRIARGLQKYCSRWEVVIYYGKDEDYRELSSRSADHDVVLFLPDFRADVLLKHRVPRHKMILAIRSDVKMRGIAFYNDNQLINNTVSCVLAANSTLHKHFTDIHPYVVVLPGGVDIHTFLPKYDKPVYPPRVGWAGSRDNFGKTLRGLDIIEEACKETGYPYIPAYREVRWRNESEMVEYYQDEIDIYVDLDVRAGRQNGMLEAASCGKAIITSTIGGVGSWLVRHNLNGFHVDRTVPSLIDALEKIEPKIHDFGRAIRQEVVAWWSWEKQAALFEGVFDEVLDGTDKL